MRKPYTLAPGFIDPFEDRGLLKYFTRVVEWHGYLRFLGLTAIWDTPDLAIDRLFVAPRLSERQITPQADNDSLKETHELYSYLGEHPRLVVLGDPGSGKSTLVSWLASRLTLQDDGGLSEAVGRLVPIPMVLRELDLTSVGSWEGLWHAFLKHDVALPLRDVDCEAFLRNGQAFVMLDGIDEIDRRETREGLRKALWDGMERYPDVRWLLTSRVLGYEEVPFHRERRLEPIPEDDVTREFDTLRRTYREAQLKAQARMGPGHSLPFPLPAEETEWVDFVDRPMADIAYAAPFDDTQIARFAGNWYAVRDSRAGSDSVGADDFVRAIGRADDTRILARTPNLLTMMALVHRNRAVLPHGKATLYEEITKAYLGGIDAFRKLDALEAFDYTEKRAWLAQVALYLQRNRAEDEGSVLIDRGTLKEVLCSAIGRRRPQDADAIAERFLEFVARRSGLLIPRTETHYAFVHLSFQEFFAAAALRGSVTSRSWYKAPQTDPFRADLARWAGETTWTETFLFLFQLLHDEPEWDPDWLDAIFGEGPTDESPWPLCLLAVRLAHNEYAALTTEDRDRQFRRCWIANGSRYDDHVSGLLGGLLVEGLRADRAIVVLRELLRENAFLQLRIRGAERSDLLEILPLESLRVLELWDTAEWDPAPLFGLTRLIKLLLRDFKLSDLSAFSSLTSLNSLTLLSPLGSDIPSLAGLTSITILNIFGGAFSNLAPLADLGSLALLSVYSNKAIDDVSPLHGLRELTSLDLGMTSVSDVSPLSGLSELTNLDLRYTNVSDVKPLSGLSKLAYLYFRSSGVSDISPLSDLLDLTSLDLNSTKVSDISPLSKLSNLTDLDLGITNVSVISPLSKLSRLKRLNLSHTGVSDLFPLSGLSKLARLDLGNTRVNDLSPLSPLLALTNLDLSNVVVSDCAALSNLVSLRTLDMGGTNVEDIFPLSGLTLLSSLDLSGTQVTDLSPLSKLTALSNLDLSRTNVTDLSPLSGLTSLKSLDIRGTQVVDLSPVAGINGLKTLVGPSVAA